MSGFLLYGGMMKAKTVIVTDERGKQYVIPGVNTAVSMLNISHTTIQRHSKNCTPVETKLGKVTLRIEDPV